MFSLRFRAIYRTKMFMWNRLFQSCLTVTINFCSRSSQSPAGMKFKTGFFSIKLSVRSSITLVVSWSSFSRVETASLAKIWAELTKIGVETHDSGNSVREGGLIGYRFDIVCSRGEIISLSPEKVIFNRTALHWNFPRKSASGAFQEASHFEKRQRTAPANVSSASEVTVTC